MHVHQTLQLLLPLLLPSTTTPKCSPTFCVVGDVRLLRPQHLAQPKVSQLGHAADRGQRVHLEQHVGRLAAGEGSACGRRRRRRNEEVKSLSLLGECRKRAWLTYERCMLPRP